jgi:hypothetical protein
MTREHGGGVGPARARRLVLLRLGQLGSRRRWSPCSSAVPDHRDQGGGGPSRSVSARDPRVRRPFFPYVVSLSVFFQVLLLPLLGAIADYSRRKKPMLFLFAYVGALATMGLYSPRDQLPLGVLFVVANLASAPRGLLTRSCLTSLTPSTGTRSRPGWAPVRRGGPAWR